MDRRQLRAAQAAARREALSAGADAGAAVSLQPGLRRLRQDSASRPKSCGGNLTPEQCFRAADECGAPIVSIPGGEPLLHPQIDEIVAGLVARRKYVYLCTNAIKLEEALPRFTPSKYLSFSVHMDGPREEHDVAVCREGMYDIAVRAIRAAVAAGFRVTTNTTLFDDADPERLRQFFDALMRLGVEGMMISPGYSYEKAPDQEHFLPARKNRAAVSATAAGIARGAGDSTSRRCSWNSCKGNWQLECTPWGNPTYNLFGWQKPCYLLDEGYVQTFQELIDTTDWAAYGRASGNPSAATAWSTAATSRPR